MNDLLPLLDELKARMLVRNSWVIENAYDIQICSERGIQDVTITATKECLNDANGRLWLVKSFREQWQKQTR